MTAALFRENIFAFLLIDYLKDITIALYYNSLQMPVCFYFAFLWFAFGDSLLLQQMIYFIPPPSGQTPYVMKCSDPDPQTSQIQRYNRTSSTHQRGYTSTLRHEIVSILIENVWYVMPLCRVLINAISARLV